MALVDPRGERHQFDRVDAQRDQMLETGGVAQRRHRAAQRRGIAGFAWVNALTPIS